MEGDITQWEYKMLPLHEFLSSESGEKTGEKKLNQLGAEGWELTGTPKVNGANAKMIFKKPKRRSYDDGISR